MINRNKKVLSALTGLILFFSLMTQGGIVYGDNTGHEPDNPGPKSEQTAEGDEGMVVTAHPEASKIGADVLRNGGNVVDAAVAIQYALNVAEPMMSGIGGGGFMMYYDADSEDISIINSRERAPAGASPDMFLDDDGSVMPFQDRVESGQSVGIPGTLKGLDTALSKWGTMPMDELIQPATELAEDGVEVNWVLADAIEDNEEKLSRSAAEDVFLPDGEPLEEGDKLVQEDLADTFELIAEEGTDVFYDGGISEALAKVVQDFDGNIEPSDLNEYDVTGDDPDWGEYEGYDIASMPPPSSGGLTTTQLLNMYEEMDLTQYDVQSPEKYHHMAEAMHLAYADRDAYMGDPEYVDVPSEGLLDPDYIKDRVDSIDSDQANADVKAGGPWDYQDGEAGEVVKQADDKENGETTHFTVADKWGNQVSYTTTNEQLFGSGIMVPGYGVMLNNELTDFDAKPGGANEVQPNKRPLSSMSPTILLDDGEPYMTIGSPGGTTIISSVSQTILNTIGYDMDLKDAIEEPRIYTNKYPDIRWEFGVPDQARRQLEEMGHEWETDTKDIGNVNSILFDKDRGTYVGAADSTREGMAIGLSSASVDYMQELVEQFARFDDITDEDVTRLLKTHLTTVEHFEDTEKMDKAVKHLQAFKQLIEQQHEKNSITDQTYEILQTNADDVLEEWEEG